eukprot:3099422-Prorocentrum_lima.AAC.1
MTSSLVGSEDVYKRQVQSQPNERAGAASQRGAAAAPPPPPTATAAIPVSYTHLTLPTICSV